MNAVMEMNMKAVLPSLRQPLTRTLGVSVGTPAGSFAPVKVIEGSLTLRRVGFRVWRALRGPVLGEDGLHLFHQGRDCGNRLNGCLKTTCSYWGLMGGGRSGGWLNSVVEDHCTRGNLNVRGRRDGFRRSRFPKDIGYGGGSVPSRDLDSSRLVSESRLVRKLHIVAGTGKRTFTSAPRREEKEPVAGRLEFQTPLNVVLYPDPCLRAKNLRIDVFDEKLEEFALAMFDAMYRTDGVGLSAPQVGVNVQFMVFNPLGERGKGQEYALVNPKIVKRSKKKDVFEEGCLSFPNIIGEVERPVGVKVDAFDLKGNPYYLELKGWQARIFQHEYDHLDGILYHDRMSPAVLQTIRPMLDELELEYKRNQEAVQVPIVDIAVGSE